MQEIGEWLDIFYFMIDIFLHLPQGNNDTRGAHLIRKKMVDGNCKKPHKINTVQRSIFTTD